ncbi:MAG: VOC family protein [Burkholderiaceae bacterium]
MNAIAPALVDHLVVVAGSLAQGAAWCEEVLGVAPGPGGEHPLMGTHNRLLNISSAAFPRCFFEIIAINPQAPPHGRVRWFDMDEPALQAAVREEPRLVHFVAQTTEAARAKGALTALGIDRGPLLRTSRETPRGPLEWQISVRADGQRLFYGGLPTLLQWEGTRPTDHMPACGITLEALTMHHPRPEDLQAAYAAIGLEGVGLEPGSPNLTATLRTPRGRVRIESGGV